jgi:hypothetical protein
VESLDSIRVDSDENGWLLVLDGELVYVVAELVAAAADLPEWPAAGNAYQRQRLDLAARSASTLGSTEAVVARVNDKALEELDKSLSRWREHRAEREQARAEYDAQRHAPDPAEAYALDDPKHPTYRERMSDAHDTRDDR